MTPEQASDFRDSLSFLLGEVSRVKFAIANSEMACEEEYAKLIEKTYETLGELVQETHELFCEESS